MRTEQTNTAEPQLLDPRYPWSVAKAFLAYFEEEDLGLFWGEEDGWTYCNLEPVPAAYVEKRLWEWLAAQKEPVHNGTCIPYRVNKTRVAGVFAAMKMAAR